MNLSIILPAFNCEETLAEAVQSILNQTYEKFELIIINDASKDLTQRVAEEFVIKDKRVKLVNNDVNLKLVKTLNKGIELAKGEYIARMDADDIAKPTRLEKQLSYLEKNPDVCLVGTSYSFMGATEDRDIEVKLPHDSEEISKQIVKENVVCHPSVMFRREAFYKAGCYREEFVNSEDYDLWLRMSRLGKIANIPEALLRYRLTITGVTLDNRWQQYIYHRLAQRAFRNPSEEIAVLKNEIEKEDIKNKEDKLEFLCHVFEHTSKLFWKLGHKGLFLKFVLKIKKEVGYFRALKIISNSVFNK